MIDRSFIYQENEILKAQAKQMKDALSRVGQNTPSHNAILTELNRVRRQRDILWAGTPRQEDYKKTWEEIRQEKNKQVGEIR